MWQSGSLRADLAFGLDPLGMLMTMIVTHVATLIPRLLDGLHGGRPAYWRFFMWLNLFVFSMLLLVMGSNFVVMFFGWEGVGLCSYGLIAFWYEDLGKARAGMKAFVVNRFRRLRVRHRLFILFWSLSGAWAPGTNSTCEKGLSGRILGAAPERPKMAPAESGSGPPSSSRAAQPGGRRIHRDGRAAAGDDLLGLPGDRARLHPLLRRRGGKERPDPALRLAPGRRWRDPRRSPP